MRVPLLAILVLSAASLHAAAAEPAPSVKTPFKFPAARTPSAPPATTPGEVPVLSADMVHVVPWDDSFLLLASPRDKVKVTRTAGPVKVYGKFLDTPGEPAKLREFTAKHIAIVEPIPEQAGRVELIAVPGGAADESGVERQLIDLGKGPQPPPDDGKKETIPGPKPVPPDVSPEPKPKPITTGPLYLILVEELDERTPATAKLVNDVAFWQRMKAKQVFFRPYDQDDPGAKAKGYVEAATKAGVSLPALILLDKDGDVIWVKPRPKDTAAVEALVREVSP